MSWKDIKQPACPDLAAPRLGRRLGPAHPPPPARGPSKASTAPILWAHKRGEVNEAWGGNYTNANRQMSHIVPSYNKQYGRPWCICIRKGGAPGKPCFDCVLPRVGYFFFSPPLPPSLRSFRVRSVAFSVRIFISSWQRGRWACNVFFFLVLPVEDSCALSNSCESCCLRDVPLLFLMAER